MKVICETQKLSEVCQIIQRSVSQKASIPALEGIMMKALGDELILTGYDMDIGINTSISARVNEPGSIIINAKTLCDILRYLPGETVVIEKQDERFKYMIRSGDTEYTIIGIDPEDYPELPKIEESYPIVVEQKILKEMIRQTIFAVAVNDSTKVVHTGIKFEITQGNIRLIALDGFRLAIRNEKIDYNEKDVSFIVPSKTLSEIMKIMNDEESSVSISIGKRHIIFEIGEFFVISRLLEGEFLNYKTAIPIDCSTTVKVGTKNLIECIERTSLIITDKIKSPIKCSFSENMINVSSITSIGTAHDKISADIQGNKIEIGFNNKFILDALKVCDVEEVKIELNGPTSPIIILDPESDKFLFLILPVRLKNEN